MATEAIVHLSKMCSKIQIGMILCFVALGILATGRDLPNEFQKCKRDETFDKCLVDAVNKALVILKDGLEDFDIAPLEPLHIPSIVVESGRNSPVTLKQVFKNVSIFDLVKTSRVLKYTTNLDKHLIVCDSFTDRVELVGDYEMTGRILLFPITGKGRANITLLNLRIEHHLIGRPVQKDGVLYNVLKEYRVDLKPKRVHMHFDNLFGDKVLSDALNRIIDENWELVFNELKGGYAKNVGSVFKNITNQLFGTIPMDKIFLK